MELAEISIMILFILVIVYFNIPKQTIILLCRKVKIFLDITKDDFFNSIKFHKDSKSQNPAFKKLDLWVVRSCSISEYLEKQRNDDIKKLENFILLFFIVGFFQIFSFIDNVFELKNQFNLLHSVIFMFTAYSLIINISEVLNKKGELKYFSLIFIIFFIPIVAVILVGIEIPKVLNHDFTLICNTINDRLNKISETANTDFKNKEISYIFSTSVSEVNYKIFLALVFCLTTASIFRFTFRRAFFDNEVIRKSVNYEQIQSIYKNQSQKDKNEDLSDSIFYTYLPFFNKLKMILSLVIFGLFIDFISFNELKSYISEYDYYKLLSLIILIETVLDLVCMRFHCAIYLNTNYFETINFFTIIGNEFRDDLHSLYRLNCISNVKLFWAIFIGFSTYSLVPFSCMMSILTILSRKDVEGYLINGLTESTLLVIIFSYYFSKGVLSNLYLFWINSSGKKKILVS